MKSQRLSFTTLCLAVAALASTGAGTKVLAALQPPLFSFDHYHSLEEIETYLQAITARHADLAQLVEIGRSRADRRILAVELNNPSTGSASDKPAFYVDGNIHGGEVLGGEAALYFLDALLARYGSDAKITELIDRSAIYIVPIVNPDGRVISVATPENHRWNIRPTDEDGDGLFDEDPPEDLDGDGRMLRMRVRDPEGAWKVSSDDPRQMVRRDAGDPAAAYRLLGEGIDNDADGRFNEDRIGGVDLNRNFPANWDPAQFASGPFPLSEPESWALVQYITQRPNIAAIHTFHTSGGLLLRFPTLADQDWDFPQADLDDYNLIAEEGVALTGYANFANAKKTIVDLMNPGHGVFNDWGSKVFGVLTMTTELWAHAIGEGQQALFDWNDEVLDGNGFIAWHPFEHPQLGTVEIGGWDRWSTASPPEHLIADELERNFLWVLSFARRLPRVEIVELTTRADDDIIEIEATVANTGWMPTATAHATEVLGIARPVRVSLQLTNAELVDGQLEVDLGVLPGARETGPVAQTIRWRVKPLAPGKAARAVVTVRSEKAGTMRRALDLATAAATSPGEAGSR